MSGLDEILNIIQQHQTEEESSIMQSAENKVREIQKKAAQDADDAYNDYMKRSSRQCRLDYENSRSSVDSASKRRLLSYKLEQIDSVMDKVVDKLDRLSDKEYFAVLERLVSRTAGSGDGALYLNKKDLERMPPEFAENIDSIAKKAGGTIRVSDETADIDDGFILEYGKISENCSFRAVLEAEKDSIRDLAARELFGR